MDQAKLKAAREYLVRRLEHEVIPSGPPETLYLRPLIRRALAVVWAESEATEATLEIKSVGQTAKAGLEHLLAQRMALVDEPLVNSSELARLLRAAVGD